MSYYNEHAPFGMTMKPLPEDAVVAMRIKADGSVELPDKPSVEQSQRPQQVHQEDHRPKGSEQLTGGVAMTREQKAWKVIMFTLLAIQTGLLIALIVTDATWNLMLLVPTIMIVALLVSMVQDKPASEDGE